MPLHLSRYVPGLKPFIKWVNGEKQKEKLDSIQKAALAKEVEKDDVNKLLSFLTRKLHDVMFHNMNKKDVPIPCENIYEIHLRLDSLRWTWHTDRFEDFVHIKFIPNPIDGDTKAYNERRKFITGVNGTTDTGSLRELAKDLVTLYGFDYIARTIKEVYHIHRGHSYSILKFPVTY